MSRWTVALAVAVLLFTATARAEYQAPIGGPAPLAPGQMRAHLIDVGQGAATLFEFSCGAALIDTGGETNGSFSSANAIRAYLNGFFDERTDLDRALDLVLLTHAHADHTDNARVVGAEFTVRNVVTNNAARGSGITGQAWLRSHAPTGHLETVTANGIPSGGRTNAIIDPLQCADEDPKLRVLWGTLAQRPAAWNARDFKTDNNHSVVVRIDFGQASFLVTGDLQDKAITSLLAKHSGSTALNVDVWQVGHHGAHNGTTQPLLDAMTPVIALLGTGPESRQVRPMSAFAFGHPRKPVIDLLIPAVSRPRPPVVVRVATGQERFQDQSLDKAIYATGWDGTVVITADRNGGYDVTTER